MPLELTPPNVADTATITADLPARGPMLLGTFGPEEAQLALVRDQDGTVTRVETGDTLDGSRVLAIEDGRLALAHRGKAIWLTAPG